MRWSFYLLLVEYSMLRALLVSSVHNLFIDLLMRLNGWKSVQRKDAGKYEMIFRL